ncbi:ABC1-domain-containing protein [Athelia psychrophila]|uniref:ABC1-domain-containing protein n=1 Tax=Athelia psychrophila TaxID=1759441 RepID=A0A166BAC1_9AGAM|nr:ABC1-domain-containing protein [Fibularhizoctonia sp. CBS 109695]
MFRLGSGRLASELRGPPSRRWLSTNKAQPSKLQRYSRRTAYFALGVGGIYVVDRTFNASSVSRNFRTLWTCALISIDYKLNFTAEHPERIPEIHQRVADLMYKLFTENGGLYIKIGQAIGANAALLPAPMRDKFSKLFDDAPQIPYSTVRSVFEAEFGRPPSGPDGVFEIFEEEAVASASIAQVHKAKLKDGGWVAVKVQKPDVGKQVEWDLGAYRICMWMFEHWVFDLPVYFVVDFVSDHLRAELDFVQEANNAAKMTELVAAEPRLAGRVHIPLVYPELSTKKVLTAEWIDGVRLSDRPAIRRLMGEATKEDDIQVSMDPGRKLEDVKLKGGVKAVMQTMVELFSAQMFSFGWVHCDPHPGNIIIRPNPAHPTQPQLVLLDHGLYVYLTPTFKREYASLWKGLISTDFGAVERVTRAWGIGTPDLFASTTLMRPVKLGPRQHQGGEPEPLNAYEQSVRMKAKLRSFLTDTDKMPKELIFLGRNMRMVQGNNQSLGSPVNRIKMTGFWASRSLTATPHLTLPERLREYWYYTVFRSVMFTLDVAFWQSKLRAWVRRTVLGKAAGGGFEDELERSMRGFAKSSMGVEIGPGAFEG